MRPKHDGGKAARADHRLMALTIDDGVQPFTISFSSGVEQFIGRYPRLDGLCPPGRLLSFEAYTG